MIETKKKRKAIFVFQRDPKEISSGGAIRSYEVFKNLDNLGLPVFRVYLFHLKGFLRYLIKNLSSFSKFINPFYKKEFLASDFLGPSLIKFLSIFGRLLYLDYHDDPLLQSRYFGLGNKIRPDLFQKVFLNLKYFELIGIVSKEFKEFLKKNNPYNISKNYLIIFNASSPPRIKYSKLPRNLVITMVSGAAPSRGIEDLIKAAVKIAARVKGMRLLLCLRSTGEESRRYLANLKSSYGKKYQWLVFKNVDFDNLSKILAQSFVGVVPHKKNTYMDFSLPIKLFDYMAAGRPVVVSYCRAMARIVKKEKCGLIAKDNPNSLAQAVLYLWKNKAEAQKLGKNGRQAIERKYNWEKQSDTLIRIIKN